MLLELLVQEDVDNRRIKLAQVIISQLPPSPDGTGSGSPKGTDLIPATDVTDTTEAPTGTTKKYTLANQFYFIMKALGYLTTLYCRVATAGALSATYNNGTAGIGATLTNNGGMAALTVDGIAVSVGDRILVWQQGTAAQNGIYIVSVVGNSLVNWVLTRATDYDQSSEIVESGLVLVNQGTTYAGICFEELSPGPFTIGVSDISFAPFGFTTSDFVWNRITHSSQQMVSNKGYVSDASGLVSLALPTTSKFGDEISIAGNGSGGWSITQAPFQFIHVGSVTSTVGSSGSVSSINQYDSINLVCTTANTGWTCKGAPQGQLTVV